MRGLDTDGFAVSVVFVDDPAFILPGPGADPLTSE